LHSWWALLESGRTAAQIPFEVDLVEGKNDFKYMKVAEKALELHGLGMTYRAIAMRLGVDHYTARKAVLWAIAIQDGKKSS
jgi:hypothetical protein